MRRHFLLNKARRNQPAVRSLRLDLQTLLASLSLTIFFIKLTTHPAIGVVPLSSSLDEEGTELAIITRFGNCERYLNVGTWNDEGSNPQTAEVLIGLPILESDNLLPLMIRAEVDPVSTANMGTSDSIENCDGGIVVVAAGPRIAKFCKNIMTGM